MFITKLFRKSLLKLFIGLQVIAIANKHSFENSSVTDLKACGNFKDLGTLLLETPITFPQKE
jgi:hypothetical protein